METRTEERRRFPGAFGYLWCSQCKARFVVAGRREHHESGEAARVVCPECKTAARTALPKDIAQPFRVLTVNEPMRRED